MKTTEALVVGGGPAGAALAIHLARGRREVLLMEREVGAHHKVCGEFLSESAVERLRGLGVVVQALGAHPIDRVRLVRASKIVETRLPFRAFSLSRYVLDQALLEQAEFAGAKLERGLRVTSTEREGDGWRSACTLGGGVRSKAVFLANGKHDLRGHHRPPGLHDDLLGFKLHWRLGSAQTEALGGVVELHLFPGGYAGLERIEDGLTNLCLVVRKAAFGDWPTLLETLKGSTLLGERLAGAEALWDKPLAIAAIPYGHVQTASDGLWRLGDQAAVIPSFAGEGMAMALASAEQAAAAYLRGRSPDEYQALLAAKVGARVRASARLSRALVGERGQTWAMRTPPWLIRTAASASRAARS